MTIITSCEELKRLIEGFTFEDIDFIRTGEDDHFIEYHKRRCYRLDLYVVVNKMNFEAEIYTWNEKTGQRDTKTGTFNIRRPDEVLFLLTHGLNELRVEQTILNRYKHEIGYDQTNVIPGRSAKKVVKF